MLNREQLEDATMCKNRFCVEDKCEMGKSRDKIDYCVTKLAQSHLEALDIIESPNYQSGEIKRLTMLLEKYQKENMKLWQLAQVCVVCMNNAKLGEEHYCSKARKYLVDYYDEIQVPEWCPGWEMCK